MPVGRPWYQRNPTDFIMGTVELSLEERGAYSEIIDHLNERDRALPDDDKYMAGLLRIPPQRWRKIRARLLELGKIVTIDSDSGPRLTNRRFEKELEERREARERSAEHGRTGGLISAARRAGQAELFDEAQPDDSRTHAHAHGEPPKSPESSQKVAKELQESSNLVGASSQDRGKKSPKINAPRLPPPQAPYAREESRGEREESRESPPTSHSTTGRLADADLKTLYDAVCEAAGYCPVSPAQINMAMKQIEDWKKLGVDFDTVVIPTIESIISKSVDPTRTLGRFRAAIAHEHARAKAKGKRGTTYRPPPKPLLDPPDEAELFRPIRQALLERCGPDAFSSVFNHVRFDDGRDDGPRAPIMVNAPDHLLETIVHGRYRPILMTIGTAHGFNEIWKGRRR